MKSQKLNTLLHSPSFPTPALYLPACSLILGTSTVLHQVKISARKKREVPHDLAPTSLSSLILCLSLPALAPMFNFRHGHFEYNQSGLFFPFLITKTFIPQSQLKLHFLLETFLGHLNYIRSPRHKLP